MNQIGPREELSARTLERLRARDEAAFSELVRLYERRVYGLVLRMLGNPAEAEEIAQEVFIQVFKAIDTFRGDSKLSTWMFRIAVNTCKNRTKYLRARHANAQEDLDLVADRLSGDRGQTLAAASDSPEEAMTGAQVERIVQRAIAEIEPSFRECLILRDVEDLSYEEIGEITGLPAGTVKSRIFRARTQLRERVEAVLGEKLP